MEIAQEEVLTCLGICMYERLHRIYMRMREEECTCKVFAAVAVVTLSQSFETAVERKRGVSQLDILYEELAKEEQQKQLRKEQKKIKRKRKKGKVNCKENECEEYEETNCSCSSNRNELSCYSCEDLYKNLTCSEELWSDDCKCEEERTNKCDNFNYKRINGYNTENNNRYCETMSLTSSMSSSPEGSELACYDDTCCSYESDSLSGFKHGNQPSLQQMLEVGINLLKI